jgi:large subunit ribosomal protein L13
LVEVVYDATDLIFGRLATVVAKQALEGKRVIVVNVENSVISGSRQHIYSFFKRRLHIDRTKYPRRPDRLFRRTVRGMLPYKKSKGSAALKRVKPFIGMPQEYEGKAKTVEAINFKKLRSPKYKRLGEVCKELGWK